MSENKQIISPIHTACKQCVFAKYENKTQVDCYLDYISKFKDKNLNILEVYDEDKEFYVINDKRCIGYKNENWLKTHELENLPMSDRTKYYFDHNHIKYTLFIDLYHFDSTDSLNILSNELKGLSVLPSNIIIVRYKGKNIDIHTYDLIQNTLIHSGLNNVEWRIQTMLDDAFTPTHIVHQSIISCKKPFFAFINNYLNKQHLMSDIINFADTRISEDMDAINILSNQDKSKVLFPVSIYKYYLYSLQQDIFKQENLYTYLS